MRSKIVFTVVLLMGLGFVFAAAQAEKKEPALLLIEEQIVKPAKLAQLDASLKEMVAYCVEHDFPYGWTTYTDDNYRYYYVVPIQDLADIGNMMKASAELGKKAGDSWQGLMNEYQKTFEYTKTGIIRTRPDLSYVPENPRLKPGEGGYIRWGMCYVKADKVSEFEEIMKKWVALCKEKNIGDGFNTFMGEMGTDNPFYFWAESGKSPADFFIQSEKAMEIFGEEAMPLWTKTMEVLRSYENKGGLVRPELSYTPKKK